MSAFSAGSIVATLGLDVSPFSAGMLEANSIMSVFPQTLTNFMVNPLLGLADILGKIGTSFVGAFSEMTGHADHLNDLAQATGVAVDQLSLLGQVAETNGSNVEGVADAFKFLGKNVSDALAGDKGALGAFKKMGVDADFLRAHLDDLPSIMMSVADSMKGMSGADRTSGAMALFGRSGTDLIQMLSQGKGAIQDQMDTYRQFGSVVTQESAKSADAWNDAWTNIGKAWEGVKTTVFDSLRAELVPVLEDTFNWVKTHSTEIQSIASTLASAISVAVRAMVVTFQALATALTTTLGKLKEVGDYLNSSPWVRAGIGALGGPIAGTVATLVGGYASSVGSSQQASPAGSSSNGVNVQSINISPPSMSADQISNVLSPQIALSMERAYRMQESQMQAARARGAL